MKKLLRFLSVLIFSIVGIFVLINTSNTIALDMGFLSLRANVGFFVLFCSVLSSLATFLLLMTVNLSSKTSNVKKQLENAKLTQEIESVKVSQLEAKIKTLEEALKKVVSGK